MANSLERIPFASPERKWGEADKVFELACMYMNTMLTYDSQKVRQVLDSC